MGYGLPEWVERDFRGYLECGILAPLRGVRPRAFEVPIRPSVRGELLSRLGRFEEARAELARAASLTSNERERKLLLEKAAGLGEGG